MGLNNKNSDYIDEKLCKLISVNNELTDLPITLTHYCEKEVHNVEGVKVVAEMSQV